MNLDIIRPRNGTEDLIFSITKNSETPNKQTHTKPQETLELKLSQPRKTSSLKPSIILSLDSEWMIGLTSLEVYYSIFSITEENNKFELYTDIFDDEIFSFTELEGELEEILDISNFSPKHLQDKIIGPRIKTYQKLSLEKS